MRFGWAVAAALVIGGCGGDDEVTGGASIAPDGQTAADAAASADAVTAPGDAGASDAATVDGQAPDGADPDVAVGPPDLAGAEDGSEEPVDATDAVGPDDVTGAETAGGADAVADAGSADAESVDADGSDGGGDGGPQGIGALCFGAILDPDVKGPDYDKYAPVPGPSCLGTNHQDITGVEQVVFLGDSVTVGTPNEEHLLSIENGHFYRNKLAEWLADTFSLDRGDAISWGFWKTYDYFSGKGGKMESGDFRNCSKWGARTDDFLEGGGQIAECFPDGGSGQKTLVVFTMGGNDISKITQVGGEATPEEVEAGYPAAWDVAYKAAAYLESAIAWLTDPVNFPNGSYVMFANPFEFTDGTGDTSACTPQSKLTIPGLGDFDLSGIDIPVAELAGFKEWANKDIQADIVIWLLEEYMRIAVTYQVDLVWMLEGFCGHGYVATGPEADVENRCYRGPDAQLWFDVSCIHPNGAGHNAIYEMFKATVTD